MGVKIHAIQTGSVQIKMAQRVRKRGGFVRILADFQWTEWLPIFAWVIEHPEGIIVVDTGETSRAADPAYFPWWHPYYRGSVRMNVKPEEEIGPQLRAMGVGQKDVKTVILTHFHTDHAGGLHHFPSTNILVSGRDFKLAKGFVGRLLGYLPQHWPKWFNPTSILFQNEQIGPFAQTCAVTKIKDVIVIPTPGHTPGHVSVMVLGKGANYFLAGDTSYNEALLTARIPDGVALDPNVARDTMDRILTFASSQPLVYLPSHDPGSLQRLRAGSPLSTVVLTPP